ncbi:MAG: FAD-dependent oxidoreductase [Candidatus Sericytochromatia bacterium]|nr:FAD-dependent oxidoreductase [Candidatus Sericytochromatia bacterium]
MIYDYIVIGSGYGGLSAAALLVKQGFSVLILESHVAIGGCASFFKRKEFTFDVGATTLSGVLPHQPLGRLFEQINIKPNIEKLDPGMIIYQKNKKITRYSDKNKWINEASEKFNSEQKGFWDEIYNIESMSWQLIKQNYRMPPTKLSDLIHLAKPSNLRFIKLLPGLIRPVTDLLKKYDLDKNEDFVEFVDEQLLISTQTTSSLAPYLTSAIGLSYPSETYYPYGGIYKPLEMVLDYFKSAKGEIKFKEKVTNISETKEGYQLTTKKGSIYHSKGIVSNIPIWNMANITEGSIKKYFVSKSDKFKTAWGAFTMYFAIEDKMDLETAYYQIHSANPLPYCSGKSFFVSFSLRDDFKKSPKGWRTVTISAHTNTSEWENISEDEYNRRKEALEKEIFENFDNFFPQLKDAEKLYINAGTPNTFKFFTNRHKGYVGGIPHSIKRTLLQMPPNVTPFKNLYLVGDTVFPGQGLPSVVLGSLNIVDVITHRGI